MKRVETLTHHPAPLPHREVLHRRPLTISVGGHDEHLGEVGGGTVLPPVPVPVPVPIHARARVRVRARLLRPPRPGLDRLRARSQALQNVHVDDHIVISEVHGG